MIHLFLPQIHKWYISFISHLLIAHNPPSEFNFPYPAALSFVSYHICPFSNFFSCFIAVLVCLPYFLIVCFQWFIYKTVTPKNSELKWPKSMLYLNFWIWFSQFSVVFSKLAYTLVFHYILVILMIFKFQTFENFVILLGYI